jgi:hypothetical protein
MKADADIGCDGGGHTLWGAMDYVVTRSCIGAFVFVT